MRTAPIFALALTITLTACSRTTAESPQTTDSGFEPIGLGDPIAPWAGNRGYDVIEYEWDLEVDVAAGSLGGSALLTASALEAIDAITLDYSGPEPVDVLVDGRRTEFEHSPPKLVVDHDVGEGVTFELEVVLDGSPEQGSGGLGWQPREEMVFTAAVLPGDTSGWVPLNDTPTDPAVFTVTIDAGDWSSVATGTPDQSDGAITWTTPMPASEFGMAVASFDHRRVDAIRFPIITVSTPAGQIPPSEQAIDEVVGDMLAHLTAFLGPFPFPTLGLTKIEGLPGANSTPGQIFLGVFDGMTVAHELAHQWIGGSVGTASSSDTWLREGIPEYLALLWMAENGGGGPLDQALRIMHEELGERTRALRDVAEPADRSDKAVWLRSPLAIHALRSEMGDEALRDGLALLFEEQRGQSITTDDFIDAMQRHTDVDVSGLLEPWIDEEEVPPFP